MEKRTSKGARTSALAELNGFGPKSAVALSAIGIESIDQLKASDPFQIYALLKRRDPTTSLNFLYAIFGALEDVHWLEIKRLRKTEILLRLEELGLAPR